MNQERTLVLEMLVAGKINVAQADDLLETLEPPSPSTQAAPAPAAKPPLLRFSPKQLLDLKNHDIDARFIRSLNDANLRTLSFEDILELGVHEVPPKFVRELRESFPEITVGQIIELHNHDIDTDFLRDMREANLFTENPSTLLELKEGNA